MQSAFRSHPRPAPCGEVSVAAMMETLQSLQHWVKLSGTEEELRSLRYVEERIASYGYQTRIIQHEALISLPGAAHVDVDGKRIACITQSFSRSSGPEPQAHEVVYLGAGAETDYDGRDVSGRIVLLEGMATPVAARRASVAGAAGQIHIASGDQQHEMCISPVWGSPSVETMPHLPSTVAVTISREDGAALREAVQSGREVRASLYAEVDTRWRQTPILIAELDALNPEPDSPFVLFSGHHDTWYHGVMDNGAANATMLEVARLFAARREEWRRGLRFAFWSGHSHGRYSGSAWYADNFWAELERRCVAHVNVDSTGGLNANIVTGSGCAAELRHVATAAIHDQAGQHYKGKRFGRQGDESFWGIGIPAIFNSISHQAEDVGAVHGSAKLGWWWHTPHDTLDKIDPLILERDTRIFVQVVWDLLTEAVLPLDYGAHATDLRALLDELDAALGARLDLADLRACLDAFFAATHNAEAKRAATDSTVETARLNRALMRVSRALVPMDYTRGDRFTHDPALPQEAWPILQPVRDLACLAPGHADEPAYRISARRAANRLGHALRQATEALALA